MGKPAILLKKGMVIEIPANVKHYHGATKDSYFTHLAMEITGTEPSNEWKTYCIDFEEPTCEVVPLGAILTMVGTGSEMNAGSVITNSETKQKIGHVFTAERLFPKFAILNPVYTMTLPHYQMVAGIYDIFNHICEQYFSDEDDNTSDYLAEGLM